MQGYSNQSPSRAATRCCQTSIEVRRACARGWIFGVGHGQKARMWRPARARAARAKCSLAGLTRKLGELGCAAAVDG